MKIVLGLLSACTVAQRGFKVWYRNPAPQAMTTQHLTGQWAPLGSLVWSPRGLGKTLSIAVRNPIHDSKNKKFVSKK